ncbi:MAG: flagellar export protein FliJ [Gammaproteobacteria bacterium]|nr:flagellar export protein FliJ [Gammaproteobacteria bacterium]
MSRSKRMQPVQQYVGKLEKDALQEFGQCQQMLQSQQQQLEKLRAYRQEYADQMTANSNHASITAGRMQDYQAFMAKLSEAIQQQEQTIARMGQDLVEKRSRWKKSHVKSQAVAKAVGRFSQQENADREKAEQKLQDEANLRKKI